MDISNRHKNILNFWLTFIDIDRLNIVNYLKNQPKLYYVVFFSLIAAFIVESILNGVDEFFAAMLVTLILQQIGIFIRFHRDWSLSREFSNWDNIDEVHNDKYK